MKKEKSGCSGHYLNENGKGCEIHSKKVLISDCKKCNCPGNIYSNLKKER